MIAIDAGTTGVRSRAVFDDRARRGAAAYREFTQIYPQPGWVEHDAEEIWAVVRATLNEVVSRVGRESVAAIGIANQRETAVAWNRRTGKPYGTAIVWQDRRTADRCEVLREGGYLPPSATRPGSCSIRTSPPRSSNGCWPSEASPSTPTWPSARSIHG